MLEIVFTATIGIFSDAASYARAIDRALGGRLTDAARVPAQRRSTLVVPVHLVYALLRPERF